MTRLIAIGAASLGLLVAGCGGDDSSSDSEQGAPVAGPSERDSKKAKARNPAAAGEKGVTIEAGDSQYGPVLFDGDDQAVYLFDKETGPASECYGACAAAWPPVLTEGDPQAGKGADEALLDTAQRNDGTTQVLYDGHPLYYYEEPPGAVTCHDVEEFGGLWLAVQPDGDRAA